MNDTTGIFREISWEMNETLKEITDRGNDAEVRKRSDGSYDVFEVEKKKRKPPKSKKP
jgi:hypothetical protein